MLAVKDGTNTSSVGSVHDGSIPLVLSAGDASEDEQRSRQKRCEKVTVLLEQRKSGLELQTEVEKYDETQARERGMERERGKERARTEQEVMKTEEGLGRKQGKESQPCSIPPDISGEGDDGDDENDDDLLPPVVLHLCLRP